MSTSYQGRMANETFIVNGHAVNASASFTRPANVTAYAVGDLIANNATAALVVPMELTLAEREKGSSILRRVRLFKSGATLTNASFRLHLYYSAPTPVNGSNGVFSTNGVANYIGRCDITCDQAFTDGAWGSTDLTFTDMHLDLPAGRTVYALLEARGAYTPISSEVFTIVAELVQD